MKTERERKEIIDSINVMLNQAYDNTLDEVFELLKKIEDAEDENDLKAYDEGKKDIQKNGTVSWEEVKQEIQEIKKDVA
ncbi:MAG: hypothetical protein AAF915_15075 [Cyanobacteria bacterium P01_D01_bin.50]